MPSELLVAKRSSASQLKSVVKKLTSRSKRTFHDCRRRIKLINHPPTRVSKKETTKPTKPKVTPEQREVSVVDDDDTLLINEPVELPSDDERGRLLRQSTLKPSHRETKALLEPDPIPPNSIDNTKRIVRIVAPHKQPIKPKTVSIGIQTNLIGSPLKKSIPPVVSPAPEPPLRSYWTHKINLPYPPSPQYGNQNTQQQQVFHHIPQQPLAFYPAHPQPAYQHFPYQLQEPVAPVHFYQQPVLTRKQRRNHISREKYIKRHL